jgi:hypothetical protein
MRKFLIPAALIASTIAAAAPAAAQWQPQGKAYGYENAGQGRRREVRIMQLDRRNIISEREARRLDAEARDLEMRFRQMSYNGIDRRERYFLQQRIERLEFNIRRQATDGNRWGRSGYGYNGYNGCNGQYAYDRDRDGRDDRYEDDRGRYPG